MDNLKIEKEVGFILAQNEEINKLKGELSAMDDLENKRVVEEKKQEELDEIERSKERFGYVEGQKYRKVMKFSDTTYTKVLSYRVPE